MSSASPAPPTVVYAFPPMPEWFKAVLWGLGGLALFLLIVNVLNAAGVLPAKPERPRVPAASSPCQDGTCACQPLLRRRGDVGQVGDKPAAAK